MKNVILGTAILLLVSIVDAMEIPDDRSKILREARRMVAVAVGANSSEDAAVRFAQEVHRQMLAQGGDRIEAERIRLMLTEMEKEKALLEKINDIVVRYGLDPTTSMISQRSADILKMDILQRHSVVSEIYEKRFLPFQELFAREDLGVITTQEDLTTIGKYIDGTIIDPEPSYPGGHPGERVADPGISWGTGVSGWRGWTVHNSWFLQRWRGYEMRVIPVREGSYSECSDFWRDHWGPALAVYDGALVQYNSAVAQYNYLKAQRDVRINEARALAFPSEILCLP
ncbi:MAG: hypothetical protein LBC04_01690 [Holosporaceae bacterium]|jgi:hypothetical protein|nr:hypothetical protein [Holosporaceae bacterium]